MSSLAVILVLSSCFTHAVWNLLSKRSSKSPAFFWVANASVTIVVTPVFFALGGADVLRVLADPVVVWAKGGSMPFRAVDKVTICLLVTGVSQACYFAFLALAYRHGDISVVYPMARTFPIFVVLLAGMIQNQWPTLPAYVGIFLVVSGCFVLPLKRLGFGPGGLTPQSYLNRASVWALLTALASSGYTIADDIGIDTLSANSPDMSGVRVAVLYGYLEYVSTTAVLFVVVLFFGGVREIRRVWANERRASLTVGVLVYVTYLWILWAYGESDKVAYVAGLRQFSIVLGVIGGILILKESGGRVRVVASIIIVAGLILIGLAR